MSRPLSLPVSSRVALSGSMADQPLPNRSAARDFDAVYAAHAAMVWRWLERLGVPRAHVADAAQDVFVVVYRKLDSFEQRSSLKTWLFGITLRVASDVQRRLARRPTAPLPAALADGTLEAPYEARVRTEAVETLYRLLDELPAEQRAVFVLVELEQMSVPEAAAAVGCNVHTVTSRLKVARKRFEAALRRHQTTSGIRRAP